MHNLTPERRSSSRGNTRHSPTPAPRRSYRWVRRITLILTLLSFGGCGSEGDLATAHGKVSLNKRPLVGAMVEFQPVASDGAPSSGLTDEHGVYSLMFSFDKPGVLTGEHIVRIFTAGTDFDAEGNEFEREELVAPEFNSESTLKRTVTPGRNTFDFDL